MGITLTLGPIKDTTGRLIANRGVRAEGMLVNGVAQIREAIGGAAILMADVAGSLVTRVTNAVNGLYERTRKLIYRFF